MKLNFLNFIALPISIGVGADYALNMVKRYDIAGPAALRRVIVQTGGAVILCSATTTLGYLVLLLTINGAVRSFGLGGRGGEIAAVSAAVLILTGFSLLERAGRAARQSRCRHRARAPRGDVQHLDAPKAVRKTQQIVFGSGTRFGIFRLSK